MTDIKTKIKLARSLAALSDSDRDDVGALVDEFVANAAEPEIPDLGKKPLERKRPGPKPGAKKAKAAKTETPAAEDASLDDKFPKVDATDDVDAALSNLD